VLIDWFTVLAQIVNFAILVGLMKHFLYGPLIQAIDSREQRLATQLAEAARQTKQSELQAEVVKEQIAELEANRAQMIEDAREEAHRQQNELVRIARESVEVMAAKWHDDVRRDEATFFQELRSEGTAEIVAITRHALQDLANSELETNAVRVFLQKLEGFDAGALRKLCSGEVTVVTPAAMSAELQREVEQKLESRIGSRPPLRFECMPEMAWGIELRGQGQRIGWTPGGYIDSLEEKLKTSLELRATEQRATEQRPIASPSLAVR